MNAAVKPLRPLFIFLAFCVLYSLSCVSVCRAETFGNIWVSADAIYTGNTFHGYSETRVSLENHSAEQAHVVTLNFPENTYGNYGNSIGRISRTVRLAPGAHEVVSLLQPPLPIYGAGSIGVEVDGRNEGAMRAPNSSSHCERYSRYSSYGAPQTTVFISRGLDFDAVCRIFNAGNGAAGSTPSAPSYGPSSGTPPGYSAESLRAEVPATQYSSDWLAYTPFDFVVMGHGELVSLPPEAATALWNYVQAGGNLLVFGESGLPPAWRTRTQKPLRDGTEYAASLGRLFVLKSEDPSAVNPDTVDTLRKAMNDESHYWQGLPADITTANSALKLVEDLKIPTRGLVFIMLVFVIIIGPVNLIVLNRRKRRTWMLWTIPTISLVTTMLVFAYSLLREGITPTVKIAGLTVLDQSSHHAATVGAEGYYCPLTPSGGLHFDSDTEATPLLDVEDRSGAVREVDWSQSQNFTSGWVSARVPAFFHLRRSETRRERVQIISKDGQLQIVNGLGAPIKSVWFADAQMNIFQAHDVAAGQSAALSAYKLTPAADAVGGPKQLMYEVGYTARVDSLDQHVANYLTPNTYIAVIEGNPFLENAMGPGANLKLTTLSGVVFGIIDVADHL